MGMSFLPFVNNHPQTGLDSAGDEILTTVLRDTYERYRTNMHYHLKHHASSSRYLHKHGACTLLTEFQGNLVESPQQLAPDFPIILVSFASTFAFALLPFLGDSYDETFSFQFCF